MKRVLMACMSFLIFIVELFFQVLFLSVNSFRALVIIILLCLVRYHNRIQWATSKRGVMIIKEVKDANI